MVRPTRKDEQQTETLETALSMLGNAIVYLSLVNERLDAVKGFTGAVEMVTPAIQDVRSATALIKRTQQFINQSQGFETMRNSQ